MKMGSKISMIRLKRGLHESCRPLDSALRQQASSTRVFLVLTAFKLPCGNKNDRVGERRSIEVFCTASRQKTTPRLAGARVIFF